MFEVCVLLFCVLVSILWIRRLLRSMCVMLNKLWSQNEWYKANKIAHIGKSSSLRWIDLVISPNEPVGTTRSAKPICQKTEYIVNWQIRHFILHCSKIIALLWFRFDTFNWTSRSDIIAHCHKQWRQCGRSRDSRVCGLGEHIIWSFLLLLPTVWTIFKRQRSKGRQRQQLSLLTLPDPGWIVFLRPQEHQEQKRHQQLWLSTSVKAPCSTSLPNSSRHITVTPGWNFGHLWLVA